MKLLITGDWHLTNKKPENRKDDMVETQERKVDFVLDLAIEHGVQAILQPGDLFDHYHMPDYVKRKWIKYFKERNITILTVPGQHDMRYHSSNIDNTPMGVLDASEVIKVIGEFPAVFPLDDIPVMIYGAGWGAEVPEVIEGAAFSVLLTHRMIINEKLWEGQEDAVKASKFLFRNKFHLIVSGDNHISFNQIRGGRQLINCGSLMRSNISQVTHQPCVWIYDVIKKIAYQHYIPIEPFEDVMDLTTSTREKQSNKDMEAFVEGLSQNTIIEGLKYKKNMIGYLKENEKQVSKGTVTILEEAIG